MWWRGTVVASPRRPWSSWCSRSCRLEGAPQERKPRRLRRQSNLMIILGWFPAGCRKKLDGLFHGKSQSKIDDFNGGSPISGNFHIWIYLWRFPTIGVPAYASSILDWNLHNFPGKKRNIAAIKGVPRFVGNQHISKWATKTACRCVGEHQPF